MTNEERRAQLERQAQRLTTIPHYFKNAQVGGTADLPWPQNRPHASYDPNPENRRELMKAMAFALNDFAYMMNELTLDGAFEDFYPAFVALGERVKRLEALPGVREALEQTRDGKDHAE